MDLGARIYDLRSRARMSQGDLAEALDVSRQSVSKWENGNAVPELEKLIKMAELFNISLDELVGRDAPPAPRTAAAPGLSVQKLLGIVLVATGIICLPFSSGDQAVFGILGILLALSGAFTFALPYPYIGIGWSALGAAALFLFAFTPRWEREYFAQAVLWLGVVGMLFWTIRAHRSGKQPIPTWLWWLGGIALSGLAILYCLNIIPR